MTDDTQQNTAQRLEQATTKCLGSLAAWTNDLKNSEARDNLLEAVHELRKVTSRLEIDITMNDRLALNAKPIPVPEHKSKMEKRAKKPLSDILPVDEIREANEKRKIAIKAAKEAETEANDDNNDDIVESDDNVNDEDGATDKPVKKTRRPRRKRPESEE